MGHPANSLRHLGMIATSPSWRRHFAGCNSGVNQAQSPPINGLQMTYLCGLEALLRAINCLHTAGCFGLTMRVFKGPV